MKIHERVRAYIDSMGLKYGFVAKKSGIEPKKFSAILCGRRKLYADDVENICKALNVPAETFYTDPQQSA